jgi:4-hydroxy-4-methyl-2-oxoglutarate aldolase
MTEQISSATLAALKSFETCAVANAIERVDVRLRNEGFTNPTLSCLFPELAPIVGFAVTLRLHGSNPPMEGGLYQEATEWWNELDKQPSPRVVVIEDADRRVGTAAFIGETHAAILQALGCVGVVTNGAVRDLPGVRRLGFQLFSGSVSVSHSYAHVAAARVPVEIAGLRIETGDLLHGDQHGVVKIPAAVAPEVVRVAAELEARERKIVEFCRSGQFSRDRLRDLLKRS